MLTILEVDGKAPNGAHIQGWVQVGAHGDGGDKIAQASRHVKQHLEGMLLPGNPVKEIVKHEPKEETE